MNSVAFSNFKEAHWQFLTNFAEGLITGMHLIFSQIGILFDRGISKILTVDFLKKNSVLVKSEDK